MSSVPGREVVRGLWRFTAAHREWTEDEVGEDGWDALVAWWAASTTRGMLLIDPLISDWVGLDEMIGAYRGRTGVRPPALRARSVDPVRGRARPGLARPAGA